MQTQNLVQDPVKEPEPVKPPLRYDVPIIVTITEEDVGMAGDYSSHKNCLLATALKRMGYGKKSLDVVVSMALVDGHWFTMDGFARSLGYSCGVYHNVVGKQVIFYPML